MENKEILNEELLAESAGGETVAAAKRLPDDIESDDFSRQSYNFIG